MLYQHQIDAINAVEISDFKSGIINYATGTGKSRIGFEIINKFNEKYPNKSVIWICEHKNILIDLFKNANNMITPNLKILNYAENKPNNWVELVNRMKFWNKQILLVINRAFLTTGEKYIKLKMPFGLIIHDECHNIVSSTIQKFYKWISTSYYDIKIIGLSATPILNYEPLKEIIISLNVVEAINKDVICNPSIYNLKYNNISFDDKFNIILSFINQTTYKKTIVWCGTISNCDIIYEEWKIFTTKHSIVIDTYKTHSNCERETNIFNQKTENAILFCAREHHEATDFLNIDGCVFMDGVKIRTEKLFMQCLGRIVRKAANKQNAWILDIDAKNIIEIYNRVMSFNYKNNLWNFNNEQYTYNDIIINKISIVVSCERNKDINVCENYKTEDITQYFIRSYPNTDEYINRIKYELDMIYKKNLDKYIMKAIEIKELCKDELYVTRGSCGSSLVCYLLGITHVNPIKYNISFTRFLHEERNELPDIDFDFAHNIRDDLFIKINDNFNSNISRLISNILWKEKSATREAVRRLGYRNLYSVKEFNILLKSLDREEKQIINEIKQELIGTKRTSMLHVGGIVFDYKFNLTDYSKTSYIDVVNEDKKSISQNKLFKIDILSNRSMTILKEIYENYTNDDLEKYVPCEQTFELLAKGNNIGLIIAESVLMKRAFTNLKPKTFEEISHCLALVRPLAKFTRDNTIDPTINFNIIYDDDLNIFISNIMKCDEAKADTIRRKIAKLDEDTIQQFIFKILETTKDRFLINKYIEIIERITEYGFCKAHSMSYSMVVWHLAYAKVHYPHKFWKAIITHAQSSYKKWVHMSEAIHAGIDIKDDINKMSIYSIARKNNIIQSLHNMSCKEQLLNSEYWMDIYNGNYYPDCYMHIHSTVNNEIIYKFKAIIAAFRTCRKLKKNKKMGFYLGYDFGKYIDIILHELFYDKNIHIGIEGYCKILNTNENIMVECYNSCKMF